MCYLPNCSIYNPDCRNQLLKDQIPVQQIRKSGRTVVHLRQIVAALLLFVLSCSLLSGCSPAKPDLSEIAAEARGRLLEEAVPDMLENLRKQTGLDDLTVDVSELNENSCYYHEYKSNQAVKKELKVSLRLCNWHSNTIDQWYTTGEDENGQQLARIMAPVLAAEKQGCSLNYITDDEIKVIVTASFSVTSDVDIRTDSGREYTYYHHEDYKWVEIDDQFVYFKSGASSGSSGNRSSGSYSSGGSSSRTSPGTYHPRKNSSDVDGYDDPDDFANDYEDEFEDYDDAYDYWEDEHE